MGERSRQVWPTTIAKREKKKNKPSARSPGSSPGRPSAWPPPCSTRRNLSDKAQEGREAVESASQDIVDVSKDMFERGRKLVEDAADLFDRGRKLVKG